MKEEKNKAVDRNGFKTSAVSLPWVFVFSHPCLSKFICGFVRLVGGQKNRGERSIPGCGAGMERRAALHDGATGGDERRHIASAHHRGSEGAQAISMNPLRNRLSLMAASDSTLQCSWRPARSRCEGLDLLTAEA